MGEFDLIQKLTQDLSDKAGNFVVGVGDDCAVIKKTDDMYLLATIDAQVDNVHFLSNLIAPELIGEKAMAINVSDIAAMGGNPTCCLVSLFIPKNLSQTFVKHAYAGLKKIAKSYGVTIIGGNITRAKEFTIDIALLGEVSPKQLLLRSGAKVKDKVFITGSLGDAAAGLYLLQHPDVTLEKNLKEMLIAKQTSPTPRIKEAKSIAQTFSATAMIDVSDGLTQDMLHITKQSNVGVIIYEDTLPISEQLQTFARATQTDPLSYALSGGEDYELLFTVKPEHVSKMKQMFGTQISEIGEITTQEKGTVLITKIGEKKQLKHDGWDHLR